MYTPPASLILGPNATDPYFFAPARVPKSLTLPFTRLLLVGSSVNPLLSIFLSFSSSAVFSLPALIVVSYHYPPPLCHFFELLVSLTILSFLICLLYLLIVSWETALALGHLAAAAFAPLLDLRLDPAWLGLALAILRAFHAVFAKIKRRVSNWCTRKNKVSPRTQKTNQTHASRYLMGGITLGKSAGCSHETQQNTNSVSHTQGTFYTRHLLHQPTFTPDNFHTRYLLQTNFFNNHLLHQTPFTPTSFYTPDTFYTRHLLHQAPFTPDYFHTRHLLHRPTFTPDNFYTRHLLHQTPFIPGTSSPDDTFYTRHLFTPNFFTPDNFFSKHILQQAPFTPDTFYTRHIFTRNLLHQTTFTPGTFYTRQLSHQVPFTPDNFSTREFSRRQLFQQPPFTQDIFYTNQLLHTRHLLHQAPFTPGTFYTRLLSTPDTFYTNRLLHQTTWQLYFSLVYLFWTPLQQNSGHIPYITCFFFWTSVQQNSGHYIPYITCFFPQPEKPKSRVPFFEKLATLLLTGLPLLGPATTSHT